MRPGGALLGRIIITSDHVSGLGPGRQQQRDLAGERRRGGRCRHLPAWLYRHPDPHLLRCQHAAGHLGRGSDRLCSYVPPRLTSPRAHARIPEWGRGDQLTLPGRPAPRPVCCPFVVVPAVYCDAIDLTANATFDATFPSTLAGTNAIGACANGLFGLPQLVCDADGTWNTTAVINPCSGTPAPGRLIGHGGGVRP